MSGVVINTWHGHNVLHRLMLMQPLVTECGVEIADDEDPTRMKWWWVADDGRRTRLCTRCFREELLDLESARDDELLMRGLR